MNTLGNVCTWGHFAHFPFFYGNTERVTDGFVFRLNRTFTTARNFHELMSGQKKEPWLP